MRPPFFSLTCAAGALLLLLSFAAKAAARPACCGAASGLKASAPAPSDASDARAEGAPERAAKPEAEPAKAEVVRAEVVKAAPEKAEAEAAPPAGPQPKAAPTPLDLSVEELADEDSYSDVFRILNDENSCSDFFGGPRLALTAFNRLAVQLRSRPLGPGAIGVVMSGGYTIYKDAVTGETYRLFDLAVINSNGPFATRVANPLSGRMQVGRFPAETRQAKALILLHELGHLVAAPGGGWLLPDDGGDSRQSERNTRAVQSRCLKQLMALKI